MRVFVALEMPDSVQSGLQVICTDLQTKLSGSPLRWVPLHKIHLTLKFLGEVPASHIQAISTAVQSVAQQHAPFHIDLQDLGVFPSSRRPQVVWVGVQAPPTLVHLQKAVENEIAPLGYPTENRPFSPHLTIARVQRQASLAEMRKIAELVAGERLSVEAGGEIDNLTLFRSELKAGGAVYNSLLTAALAG
jgi:2'-5' RNA ligase